MVAISGKSKHQTRVKEVAGKVAKNVVHKAKVGRAAVRLAGKMTLGAPKMIADAAKGKGVTLPGSKYIGPGNSLDRGAPKGKADAAAKQHDIDYDNYIKKGVKKKDVYMGYSDADKRLQKKSDTTTSAGLATYMGMKGKQLLNKTGLTKRIRDKDVYGGKK